MKKLLIISLIFFSSFNFSKDAFYPEYFFISSGERSVSLYGDLEADNPGTLIASNSVYSLGVGFNLNSNILEINY